MALDLNDLDVKSLPAVPLCIELADVTTCASRAYFSTTASQSLAARTVFNEVKKARNEQKHKPTSIFDNSKLIVIDHVP